MLASARLTENQRITVRAVTFSAETEGIVAIPVPSSKSRSSVVARLCYRLPGSLRGALICRLIHSDDSATGSKQRSGRWSRLIATSTPYAGSATRAWRVLTSVAT